MTLVTTFAGKGIYLILLPYDLWCVFSATFAKAGKTSISFIGFHYLSFLRMKSPKRLPLSMKCEVLEYHQTLNIVHRFRGLAS